MKRDIIFVMVILILNVIGCARPKYVQETAVLENKLNQDSSIDCSVKWSQSGLCLYWSWEKKPTTKEAGVLVFKSFRLNQLDKTPLETDLSGAPEVVLWMPEMGHGSVLTVTDRIDTGTYRATNIFFLMPGNWEIKFDVKNNDTVIESATVAITF